MALLAPIGGQAAELCSPPAQVIPWDYPSTQAITRGRDWRNADLTTDYWVLALSWSPAFCARYAGRTPPKPHQFQCAQNTFGLVVHGLWPQSLKARGDHRRHPRNCRDTPAMPESEVRKHLCMSPGVRLLQLQWERHGSCAFDSPGDYFEQAKALFSALNLPPPAEIQALAPESDALGRALVERNRHQGLRREHLRLEYRKGRLQEVRLCYDLGFRPRTCPR